MMKLLLPAVLLGLCASAAADLVPRPMPPLPQPIVRPEQNRDPVALARRDPAIARLLVEARGGVAGAPASGGAGRGTGPAPGETAAQVPLGGQCGVAGCSASTLVAFTFRAQGANPSTRSVLALVTCPPVGECKVSPAEVRPVAPIVKTTK